MRLVFLVATIIGGRSLAQRGPDGPLVHVVVQVLSVADRPGMNQRGVPAHRRDPSPPSDLRESYAPMRKTLLPHLGQVPFQAGLPFFMVTLTGFFISTFILSRTQ